MFKTGTSGTFAFNSMGAVDRSVARYGIPAHEAVSLDLLEDPIEFSQNILRVLYSSNDLGNLLCGDAPKRVEGILNSMRRTLDEALDRKDWAAAKEINFSMEATINTAMSEASEYGVAMGAVMEQLRQGLLEIAHLRYTDRTNGIDGLQSDLEDAQDVASGKRKPKVFGATPEGEQDAA